MIPKRIPDVTFQCRVGDEQPEEGGCPIGGEYVGLSSTELFGGKKVILFSLPGALLLLVVHINYQVLKRTIKNLKMLV